VSAPASKPSELKRPSDVVDGQAASPALRPQDPDPGSRRTPMRRLLVAAAMAASILALVPGTGPASPSGATGIRVYFPRGDPGLDCERVYPVRRTVRTPAVLKGALQSLLRGPTAAERQRGYGGWFSAGTAGMLRSIRLSRSIAYVDFRDFRRVIPNASSSCGSAMLLAQLDRTATQFPTVRRAIYSLNGSRSLFYEWLQLSPP
jgi:Sporulation and spore germination